VSRNKRPALTSPWKIGFLVSLLLVTVSIGVGFAITRTFGVEWSWIQFGDTWAFDKKAFMQEMLPLVVIVPVMSLLAYLVITGAVRKYRAYFDSGLDYRNLVKSIRKIDDLQEDRIKSLSGYPELRDFLLKLRERVAGREKALDEREAEMASKEGGLSAAEQYNAEASVLTGAIKKGPVEGFGEELALSIPEMQQIEQAVRQYLLVGPSSMTMGDIGEQMRNIREELTESTGMLKGIIAGVTTEMITTQNGAREIEMYLNQLKTMAAGSGGGTGGGSTTLALVDRLDQTSAALGALGEETKSIAINTALQAGQGQGGLTELVNLADCVRDVAARFNGIAAQYMETGQQIRATLQTMPGKGGNEQLAEMIETMSGKVTYWVERAVVIAEKLNSFDRQFTELTAAFEAKLGGEIKDETYQAVDDLSSDGADGSEQAAAPHDRRGEQAPGTPLPTAKIAGLEQNRNLFEEISGGSDDNLFADIPADADSTHTGLTGVFERNEIHSPSRPQAQAPQAQAPQAQAPQAQAPPAVGPAEAAGSATDGDAASSELFEEMETPPPADQQGTPEQPLAPPAGESRIKPGDFVQSKVDLSNVEVEGTDVPASSDQRTPAVDTSLDLESHRREAPRKRPPEKEAIPDLYELGAVDYEPSIHTNA
jgi:hypothetical protein